MKAGHCTIEEDGNSIKTTIAVVSSPAGKFFLYTLNILLIAVVVLFFIGDIGIITLFIAVMEVLLFRYSLWNLYGSETIVLKKHTLSHQQYYGFISMPLRTVNITKSLRVIPFHENFQAGNQAMKLIFESIDERLQPVNLYQTALPVSNGDYKRFMTAFNRFNQQHTDEYLLPLSQMN